MSSQADKIKAFRSVYHSRIQKQEDEESWISSEELCTEGSSDEDIQKAIKVKLEHRKAKYSARSKRRGISPLALPPKTWGETSSDITMHQLEYSLPDISFSNKIADQSSVVNFEKLCSGTRKTDKAVGASESSADISYGSGDLDFDVKFQWRPKRGSLKMPVFEEDEPETMQHTVFQMDLFYTEMMEKVKRLKKHTDVTRKRFSMPELDDLEWETSSTVSFDNWRNQPDVQKSLEEVLKLDEEIFAKQNLWKAVKNERQQVQKDMCEVIHESDFSLSHRRVSQTFLDLCSFETSPKKTDEPKMERKTDIKSSVPKKQPVSCDKDFVTRNIKLAKERSMAFSLTDEEKLKLERLLADIDSELYNLEQEKRAENNEGEEKTADEKYDIKASPAGQDSEGFKLLDAELKDMIEVDTKLNELSLQRQQDGPDTKQLIPENDDLEEAEKQGKHWKQDLAQKRLQSIDKELADIASQDLKEKQDNETEENKIETASSEAENTEVENEII